MIKLSQIRVEYPNTLLQGRAARPSHAQQWSPSMPRCLSARALPYCLGPAGRHIGEEAIACCNVCLAAGRPPFAPRALIASPLLWSSPTRSVVPIGRIFSGRGLPSGSLSHRRRLDFCRARQPDKRQGTLRAKSGCWPGFIGRTQPSFTSENRRLWSL